MSQMHPMLEKVARAICEARAVPGSSPAHPKPWSSDVDKRAARAAVRALMEPDEGMVERGVEVGWKRLYGTPERGAKETYRAMLLPLVEGEGE